MKNKKKVLILISTLLVLTAAASGLYWGLNVDSIFKQKEKEALLVDVEWYSEDGEEFTITTVEELYDVAALSEYYNFEGQTLKLGADLVINEGNAVDWAKDAPERKWWPIRNFAGTFDGDGHIISGLYGFGADHEMGLFSNTKPKAVIRNFELRNSYLRSSGEKVGAISSNGSGSFSDIYTNAIVQSDTNAGTGGFIGKVDSAGESAVVGFYTTFTGCWFDGEVILTANHGCFGGGFVGNFTSGTLELKQCLSSGKLSCVTIERGPHVSGFIGDTNVELGTSILKMDGCLNTSEIIANNVNTCGSIAGRIRAKCAAEFVNCYTIQECLPTRDPIGVENNITGNALRFSKKVLEGYGGYQWTNLDFDNYWTVVMDGTPVLKKFTEEVPSLEGIAKAFDIDWYDKYSDELIIDSKEKLFGFFILPYTDAVTYSGQTIKLGCDITVNTGKESDWLKETPAYPWLPVGNMNLKFEGTFDGQGHTLSGIYSEGNNYVGLFGVTAQGSVVKNLKLVNSYIKGNSIVGGIIGRTFGDVENIYCNATVVSTVGVAGGIVGQSLDPKTPPIILSIKNCWFDGKIDVTSDGFAYAGGILGDNRNNHVTIAHCLNSGSITTASNRYNPLVGGINGSTTNEGAITLIDDCLNVGMISAPISEQKGYVASIVGYSVDNNTKVTNSYATAESWGKATTYLAQKKSTSGQWPEKQIKGYGGYQWTTLDFKNYWAVVENGTPILKSFAKKVPSVAGIERKIDVSWYDEKKNTYILDSAADLVGFNMLAIGNDFKGKTVKLGADLALNVNIDITKPDNVEVLWTSVGNMDIRFLGVFDGQGHTISGICAKGTTYVGFFGVTGQGSMVKNLRLVNSYLQGESVVGGVIGRALGDIESVYCNATVIATSGVVGGIVGQSLEPEKPPIKVSIKNCWFDGKVEATAEGFAYAGGILGDNRNNYITIAHCLNSGSITTASNRYSPTAGGINGTTTNEGAITLIDDCLNVGTILAPNSEQKNLVASIIGNSKDANTKVTNSFATAESCSKATSYIASKRGNNGQWSEKQILGYGGYQWTTLDFENYWTVVEGGTPILKTFATTVPSVAGIERKIDLSWYNEKKDTYILDSAADLVGFNMLARDNEFSGKTVKLGADISFNVGMDITKPKNVEFVWTSVGTMDVQFKGTFDGQGHTISGICTEGATYVGLFGVTGLGSKIKNLKLLDSYIKGNLMVGGIVGRAMGDIEGVYCNATIISTGGYVGGIVGQSMEPQKGLIEVSITNCWFDGKLEVPAEGFSYAGGILGENRYNYVTIDHCLYSGEITTESNRYNVFVGGIQGSTTNKGAVTRVIDCLSIGTISADKSANKSNIGSLVGFFVDSGSSIVDSSATSECWSAATAWIAGSKSSVGQVAEADIIGVKGYLNTTLDFDNEKYWVAVENGTPELKLFSTGKRADLSNVLRTDTSWYDPNKTEFVLTTPEQFMGLSRLATEHTFEGKTIRLGADITINQGSALAWSQTAPDIAWMPIGNDTTPFEGTFDGEDPETHKIHTISGIYKTGGLSVGLFGVTAKGKDGIGAIKNLIVTDSYFEGSTGVGTIIGKCGNDVDTIYSSATIKGNHQGTGGIVGIAMNTDVQINNCWYAGQLEATMAGNVFAGGILGYARGCTTTMKNCLNTGSLKIHSTAWNKYVGGIIGGVNTEGIAKISSCIAAGTLNILNTASLNMVGSIIGGTPDTNSTVDNSYGTTECWSAATIWLGSTKSTTGQKTEAELRGSILDLDNKYWMKQEIDIPVLKSFKTLVPDVTWYTSDAVGKTYTLSTAAQLQGLAKLSQIYDFEGQTIELDKELTHGINLKNVVWTPIGSESKPFAGSFNGNGKTITGLYHTSNSDYVGLFGVTTKGNDGVGVIKNLIVTDSYLEGKTGVGTIIGKCGSDVDTIYSSASVTGSHQGIGGIVGIAMNTDVQINNCWYTGQLESKMAGNAFAGGILGYARACTTTMKNCLNTGDIKIHSTAWNKYVGGIIGGVNTEGVVKISSCVGAGKINLISTATLNMVGSIIGGTPDTNSTVTNSYGTTECWSAATIWLGSTKSTTGQKTEAELKGSIFELDSDAWTAMNEGIPVLTQFKSFATK